MRTSEGNGHLPRIVPGLVHYTVDESYVVEGAATTAVFSGPGATDLLPKLCALLDGTRTPAQVGQILELPTRDVEDGVDLLLERGLAEIAPRARPQAPGVPPATRAFLARSAGTAERRGSGAELAASLRRAPVLVAGRQPLAAAIRAELTAAGGVTVADASSPRAVAMVVQVLDDAGEVGSELFRECRKNGTPWLGVGVDPSGGFVGPTVHPDYSCFPCAWSWLAARARRAGVAPAGDALGASDRILAGLAVAEVLHALTGAAEMTTVNRARTVVREEGRGMRGPYSFGTEQVFCTTGCSGDTLTPESLAPWTYEQHVALPGPLFATAAEPRPAASPPHPRTGYQTLLTCPAATRSAMAAAGTSLRTPSLVLALTLGPSAGREAEPARRPAPSAGGLTSQEAYVVARAPLPLLDSHTAWYDGHGDRFVATAPTTDDLVARLMSEALPDSEWQHAVVWVARVGHLSRKYGDLAVRLAHLDAGVAMTHALLVAATLGSRPRMPTSWRSAPLTELLDLSPDTEIVTGITLF
ncbi:hypothetical protein [Streptomyces sp. B6B3]|uniref:hypothetical protein n=1 Tax=Streptomyces sp. B6B3 TaxID=3153570 RepID=UPI00325E5BB3